eukprot:Phypoly_transcript_11202.p1 GENE.Phypoly_transcript_11202~~Phypoly_transcript_11202.p1  ORF type:complete len:384 (-),score=64.20 Phypoly_transcript_11202:3-1154(-)
MDSQTRKIAEEISEQLGNRITNDDISIVSPNATSSERMKVYLEKLGGPTNLVPGSAAKRLYDSVTFWETGLMLARVGNGIDALNLLFRALITEVKGCTHCMIDSGDPNRPDGTQIWIHNAISVAQDQVEFLRCDPAQKEWLRSAVRIKLLVIMGQFYSSLNHLREAIEQYNHALEIIKQVHSKWNSNNYPKDIKGYVSWLPDESPFLPSLIAQIHLLKVPVFGILAASQTNEIAMNAFRDQALASVDDALRLIPNHPNAVMSKAVYLLAFRKNPAKKKEAMEAYQKVIQLATDDDPIKAIASYQYTMGLIFGWEDTKITVKELRKLYENALQLEKISSVLYGEKEFNTCDGKQFLQNLISQLDEEKVEEDAQIPKIATPGEDD